MNIFRRFIDFVFSPTEEVRGQNDTVSDLLTIKIPFWRVRALHCLVLFAFCILAGRLVWLQLGFNTDFLKKQGDIRFLRTVEVPAMRGKILDRNGSVLASSVPARALWIIPQEVKITTAQKQKISKILGIPMPELNKKFNSKRSFVYLKRQVLLDDANEILAMKIPGLLSNKEFLRHYPDGPSMAQIVGLTGIDGNGVEGIEYAAEKRLAGSSGTRQVTKDRLGRIINDGWIKEPKDGEDITLTVDSRIQNIAFEVLERQVKTLNAKAGAIVVADPSTGDILALANYPSYDPNARKKISRQAIRNRAITDTFEPGSTMKPFSVAAGLEEKLVNPNTLFQIGHSMTIGRRTIGDSHYSKELTVAEIIRQSSNIGTSKIALLMTPQTMWGYYDKLGFGKAPHIGFPGAVSGRLRPAKNWQPIEQATMSYGHGVTVSLLQQVRAYTALARSGDMIQLSIYKHREPSQVEKVFSDKTIVEMKKMLASVVEKGGTGVRAQVEGYSVAGKTGTAYKVEGGQYVKKYVAGFAGYAPAHDPRIVVGVMIDEPMTGKHYGSTAAAPVFSEVVSRTLRLMAVNPDKPINEQAKTTYASNTKKGVKKNEIVRKEPEKTGKSKKNLKTAKGNKRTKALKQRAENKVEGKKNG